MSSDTMNAMMDSDEDDGCPSSPGSIHYDESGDLMSVAMGDDVTAQLAAAGWKHYGDVCFAFFVRLVSLTIFGNQMPK